MSSVVKRVVCTGTKTVCIQISNRHSAMVITTRSVKTRSVRIGLLEKHRGVSKDRI